MPPVVDQLRLLPPDIFASRHIFEPVPFVFGNDMALYVDWKTELATNLEIDPRSICLVGSAALGVSLSPSKNLRKFNENSDIDVAVISNRHFEVAWHALRTMGTQRLRLSAQARNAIQEHKERLVFYGTIATDLVLQYLPFGKEWLPALSHMGGVDPTLDRKVNARIYRDFESLRAYQLISVQRAKAKLGA